MQGGEFLAGGWRVVGGYLAGSWRVYKNDKIYSIINDLYCFVTLSLFIPPFFYATTPSNLLPCKVKKIKKKGGGRVNFVKLTKIIMFSNKLCVFVTLRLPSNNPPITLQLPSEFSILINKTFLATKI